MTTDMDRFRRTLEDGVTGDLEGYVDEMAKSIVATVWNACDDERGRLLSENEKLRTELERAKRPSYSDWHVWMVWEEEGPMHGLYATEDDARQGSIDFFEENAERCPDYSWKPFGGDALELLVGGETSGIYIRRHDVFGKAMVAARKEAAS